MEYRRLGSAGLKVSVLSFGSWVSFKTQMGTDTAYDCMVAAYDAGVNFLQKPFSLDTLATRVRAALDGGRAPATGP